MTISGSPATPVWVVPHADLKKNGGTWAVLGQAAVPITGATAETINSEGATAGEVLTANGSGGAEWLPSGGGGVTLLEDPPDGNGWLAEVLDLTSFAPGVPFEVDVSVHIPSAKVAVLMLNAVDFNASGVGAVELRPTSASTGEFRFLIPFTNVDTVVLMPLVDGSFYVTTDDGGGMASLGGKIYLYGGLS